MRNSYFFSSPQTQCQVSVHETSRQRKIFCCDGCRPYSEFLTQGERTKSCMCYMYATMHASMYVCMCECLYICMNVCTSDVTSVGLGGLSPPNEAEAPLN